MNDIIIQNLKTSGVKEIGFSRIDNMPLKNAVSIVIPLSKFVIGGITDKPTFEYFHHYRTVNAYIDNTLLKCGLEIASFGYDYQCVAASQSTGGYKSYFPHKTAARLAGLGWIGKNGLFISEKYGPAVRLGTILTNMPLRVNEKPAIPSKCADCNICVSACPAMAISGEEWSDNEPEKMIIDPKACSDYMKKHFQKMGRGVVCGICIVKCRMNTNNMG